MRNAFVNELTKLAETNDRIVLLSGDIGNRLFDDYKSRYPQRFFNCGVAEANMMSMASGMALSGMRPITYTITPFTTARCYEQIKVDVSFHNLPVIIVGIGSGLSYAELGATHHSNDDIALLRILPNMTVICPADSFEVRAALRAALNHGGPVYIRLGKKGEPIVHGEIPGFVIGKGIIVRDGKDVCLLSTGNMLSTVMEAAGVLQGLDISARVVSFHTVKPLDAELLSQAFAQFRVVVSIEEHGILGGFGSSIAEWLAGKGKTSGELVCMGVADTFFCEAGKQKDARRYFGLTPEMIAKNTMEAFFKKAKK
jgi:transketolase